LRRASVGTNGGIPGQDHGFERASLMLEITFGGLDEVRDQIVAPFELNINLRVGVLVTIAQRDQRVVSADNEH
jgi:hypothetical protein